jgi:pimeloyl-ACP methyl ester carboxylesterase
VLVAMSLGATWALELGALHPERVAGIVFIAPGLPLGLSDARRALPFIERLDTIEGWAKFNQHYWREHYREFLEFFFAQMFTEPHSTKPIEDTVGWGLETDPETLIATRLGSSAQGEPFSDPERAAELATRVRCPVLVVHGDQDAIRPLVNGAKLAELANGELVTLEGSGHAPHVRDPVKVNLFLRDFIKRSPRP